MWETIKGWFVREVDYSGELGVSEPVIEILRRMEALEGFKFVSEGQLGWELLNGYDPLSGYSYYRLRDTLVGVTYTVTEKVDIYGRIMMQRLSLPESLEGALTPQEYTQIRETIVSMTKKFRQYHKKLYKDQRGLKREQLRLQKREELNEIYRNV